MSPTRRRLLLASPGLAMPFVRPSVAARRGLTFAARGGLFQEIYEAAIIGPFSRAHPDIDVFYYPIPESTQSLAALRRQRDVPNIDVVLLTLETARQATDDGLLEPLTEKALPVLTELAPSATFPGIAGRAVLTEPLVLLYDTARVPPPPGWKFLWSGLRERSLVIPAPPDAAGIAFTVVAGRLFGGGDELRAASDGITAISELRDQVATWDPASDVYHAVGDENVRYGVGWNMPAQVFSDRRGGRVAVAFPAEGTISRVVTVNLVKGSRQPDAARLLISWLLGAEAQQTMVSRMYFGPVNARGRYIEAALARTASTPERVARAMPVDWVSVAAAREGIIRRWHQVIDGAA